MSTREQHTPTIPTPAVRNTGGRSGPQGLEEPTSDEFLRELCDKSYHQLLPLIAEKMQKEKEQQDKLNTVKARLLYGNKTGKNQRNHEESHYFESKTPTARTEPKRRHGNRRSRSPSPVSSVFKRLKQNRPPSPRPRPQKEGGVFNRLGGKERSTSARSDSRHQGSHEKEIEVQPRKHHHRGTSSQETSGHSESEDSEGGHWKSKSRRHRTRMPSHVKTYDGSGDPEDHLKLFQAAKKTESIQGNLSLTNKTHQGSGGDTSYQAKRWRIHGGLYGKIQSINPGCERSAGMHEDLRIHARVTTSFLQGEVAAFSYSRKKAPALWKQPEGGNKPNFKKGFKNKQRSDRKPDRFSLLTKTPKEIFALEKGKFKAPPLMVTHAKKKDPNKYCEFHADTGHSTDECMQLRKQIDEMTKVSKQRVTQSFSPETIISFPSLGEEDGTEGPMIIEAEIGGHFVHRIYVDGGASSEVLYEHCFVRLRPEIRSQMIPATTSLIGFSGETIWPIGQISLLVKIGDEEHSTYAWMNFMVIRSPSQHNGIIGRMGIRKICVVPSTAHGMLKFPVKGGTVTIRSRRVIPMECAMIFGPSTQHFMTSQVLKEKIKVAIHPEYPEQTIAIGSTLTEKGCKELCVLLRQNLDVFAW
ncbi:hypothetical protein Tco_1219432 [Tanacetum coccineum]